MSDLQPSNIDYSGGYSPSYDNELDSKRSIRQYINVIYKRLPLIIAITILATAVAAIYMYQQPSRYQATSTITIEPRKAPATKKDSININFGDDQKYYNTQLKLIQNQDLMRRVVIALGLHREPNLFNDQGRGLMSGLRSLFGGGQKPTETQNQLPVISTNTEGGEKSAEVQLTPEEAKRADAYSARLSVTVAQEPQTNIVRLTVDETIPELTSKVADKVAELFINEDRLRETEGARRAYEDLGKSIDDLRAAISVQESDLTAEMKSNQLPLQDKGSELRAGNLQALLGQWRNAQEELSKYQAQYSAAVAASQKGDILAIVSENKALQDARSQNIKRQADLDKRIEEVDKRIDEKEQRLKELQAKYTDEYRDVITVKAEIAEMKEQKKRVEKEVTDKIGSEGFRFPAFTGRVSRTARRTVHRR